VSCAVRPQCLRAYCGSASLNGRRGRSHRIWPSIAGSTPRRPEHIFDAISPLRCRWRASNQGMVIYLFRDKSNADFLLFLTDVTGRNIPPAAANTELFTEALNTLRSPGPWDVGDFQYALDLLAE
jgi:hypothetical protein